MDDATKKMMVTVGATVAKNALLGLGGTLATHGIINANGVETFVSVGMIVVGAGWSLWNSYGRAIVLSQLEVLKAKSLAQAAALRDGGIKAPDAQAVAAASAKSPDVATLSVEEVKKAAATLPAAVAGATALLALFFIVLTVATPALAQGPIARKIQQDIATKAIGGESGSSGGLQNILTAFDDKLLPDLQFALNIAEKSGNKTTAACWAVWIDRINARKTANTDAEGKPLLPPEPHVITDFQKIMDLRNSLQPDSPFMVACQPIASMIKRDIQQLIGLVIGGGVGLASLVPGL